MSTLLRPVSATCTCITLLAMLLVLASGDATSAQGTTSAQSIYLPLVTQISPGDVVIALVNQQRHLHGCDLELQSSPELNAAAYEHSRDMALNDYFSHTGSDQSTIEARVVAAHYQFAILAENIAVGYPTPETVVGAWMASLGHSANILNCELREIGVGMYYQADDQANVRSGDLNSKGPYFYYWTQDFGTPLR